MMDAEILDNYRKAGRILAEVLQEAKPKVDVGVPLLEVAEFVEEAIRSKGGLPAFPCNISLDRSAAHYTPSPKDESVFAENMVKLDVGVHVDGYIADAAITIDLSGHEDLALASQAGLDAALELVGPGVSTADIGKAIEEAIVGYGYKPVYNLTGHGLSRYIAHDLPAVPNKRMDKGVTLKEGDVIAIEPFATNGSGRISEAPITEIYGFSGSRPQRLPAARALMKEIVESYKTLPFARRWLKAERAEYALMHLVRSGAVHGYPVLWEVEGALVSQAEHTVLILENGCEVTTRIG
ncbi:MAG: type II methionyl aminopeptidase [Methanothrix soehngenii]|jgi:methionyl aminopeptidase|nr:MULTISPECIES: type II methionyl aminopeptidase [Methanothrix]MCK9587246.1 type II methionyl aminopeptidase [Methanothrix soehngenii]MDD3551253.1 type II methionyl aminopeptidase [Methanothrix soehngenii]MDD4488612.1 type II methionyl aminopeptidase [Methanothrix soehngenii]MDD5257587.1 type II methionyl aminopeptidase [Methanothrix soehngenii]MDD5734655.1 type II methionyl aminopeptidase [Methanothrix soehngenii]